MPADELIEQQVEVHDRTQFEIKLDFNQDLALKRNCYRVEAFYFIPRSLRIDRRRYTKDLFYQDRKTNIRLGTPQIALSKLIDPESDLSLQSKIYDAFDRLISAKATPEDVEHIEYEIKLFACTFRGQIRDQVAHIIKLLKNLQGEPTKYPTICDDITVLLRSLLNEAEKAIFVYRDLRSSFLKPAISKNLKKTVEEVNEFLSLVLENYLSELIIELDSVPDLTLCLSECYEKTFQCIDKEYKYRRGADYLSSDPLKDGGELYLYRKSELKKTIMAILFLKPLLEKEGTKASTIVAAFAAAVAMAWALWAMVVGQEAFLLNSFPFLVIMVLAYIVKDRMKEWIKHYLGKQLERFFSDHRLKIYDPKSKKSVGHIRETFEVIGKEKVPSYILRSRYPVYKGKRFETIVKHEKVVTLFTDEIKKSYSRLVKLNDITRISVKHFIAKMDDPTLLLPCYLEKEKSIKRVALSKVYHVNLVLRLSSCNKKSPKQSILKHFRIILNKDGIRRLETLSPDRKSIIDTHFLPSSQV
jgi:hypothetical protein